MPWALAWRSTRASLSISEVERLLSTVRLLAIPARTLFSATGLVGATLSAFLRASLMKSCWRWIRARSLSGTSWYCQEPFR